MSIIDWPPLPEGFSDILRIAGVDEVGRGPLAGPVVAAAVILPAQFCLDGLNDSKKLSANTRTRLASRIAQEAEIGIGYVPAAQIDQLNIRQASLLAMKRAIFALPSLPDAALIDGRDIPPHLILPSGDFLLAKAIIKGDSKVAAIAAASIIAKVARDAMMNEAGKHFFGYRFEKHAGYPTKIHREAIEVLGLSALHRRSFGPCKPK